jgi:energy-coupling factor transporter transmembrane protein EcfT
LKTLAPKRRDANIYIIKSEKQKWRVDTYLMLSLKPRIVRSVAHYDYKTLEKVFRQNHVNALIVQLFGLIVLIALGYLIDQPFFRIPAGASVFILGSVVVAIAGAITYWFNQWRITVLVILLFFINYLTSFENFNHKNKAYGLDYTGALSDYTYENLDSISSFEKASTDKANTVEILNNWRSKFPVTDSIKPKMAIFCVSGGGLKASVWAMQVMQQSDSLMNGALFENTMLMTGASGGMFGAAYLRELLLKKKQGEDINLYDKKYIDNISKDLLNSIAFTIASNDLFLPWTKFETGGFTYRKDRGYIFEKQLNENTDDVFAKTIGDYKQPEHDAEVPMIFITPSIVNDGRRMIISPHGVSYMTMAPIGIEERNMELDAIDFGKLFAEQGAQNLQFTTALRMNATYPYILPNVHLPTHPGIEVMDAGFRDNYGIMSATRFIQVFQDWIKENTSGVVLIQVSGWDKLEEIQASDNEGTLESILNPLGIAGRIMMLQDYENDNSLGLIYDILGKDNFDVIRFAYHPAEETEKASMTFHLTQREKKDILNSFYLPKNQESLEQLIEVMALPQEE